MTPNTILVTGGTGKTGRRITERLVQRGLPVRVGSRVEQPPFSWTDRATWPAVLDGVTSAYLSYYPDIAFPGAVDTIADFCEVAVESGTRTLVLLSGRGEEEAKRCEDVVAASGATWTVVRCSWFNQNFSEDFLLPSVLAGEIALPAGDAVEPFVDADDIADVAVAALTEDGHGGAVYELTGPRLLSMADIAAELTSATGREIAYLPVSQVDYAAVLAEVGMPVEFADLFTKVLDGRNANLTDGVARALGRAPKDFADFAKAAAATGVWAQSSPLVTEPA